MEKKQTTDSKRPDDNLKQHKREDSPTIDMSMEMLFQGGSDTLDMTLDFDESISEDYNPWDEPGIGGYMFNHDILTGKFGCDSLCDEPDCRFELVESLNEK